jgi:CNT family concentrative nucleoside transporter
LGGLPGPVGNVFKVVTLANIQGVLFYPLTILTGVPLSESWEASVIIGRRLLETAIPPYQALAEAAQRPVHPLSDRTVLIVSYALSGFAHLASVGIFVGGTIALIPSRRKDISELGWKALFAGTLATIMIACLAGVFDTGDPSILGVQGAPASITAPAASPTVSPVPGATISPVPTSTPVNPAITPLPATTISPEPTSTPVSPALAPSPATRLQAPATPKSTTPRAIASPRANPTATPPATPRATPSPTQQAPQPKPTASAVPSPSR